MGTGASAARPTKSDEKVRKNGMKKHEPCIRALTSCNSPARRLWRCAGRQPISSRTTSSTRPCASPLVTSGAPARLHRVPLFVGTRALRWSHQRVPP